MEEQQQRKHKRPKLRTTDPAVLAAQSISKIPVDYLVDFSRAFLNDSQVKSALHARITRNGHEQETSEAFKPVVLPEMPLAFDSTRQYLATMQHFLLEEAKYEFLIQLQSPELALPRVGFVLALQDYVLDTPSQQECSRVCRLRAKLRLPDRNARLPKTWKEAEEEQITHLPMLETRREPIALSKLCRGDAVILTNKPLTRTVQSGSNYTTMATILAVGLVNRPARPVSCRETNGAMDVDVSLTPQVTELLHGNELYLYLVPECNLITAWREWDGMNTLLTESSKFVSPLLPQLLASERAKTQAARQAQQSSPPPPSDTKGGKLDLPGLTLQFQTQLFARYNASQVEAISAATSQKRGFVLVQGPPGTGKTHTLYGILNALHLSVCHLSYDTVLPRPGHLFNAKAELNWLSDQTNPHLLICAPSNAAIDNVLRLVTERGFKDGSDNTYHPTCVRIGSSSWNRAAAAAATTGHARSNALDTMVEELMTSRKAEDEQSKSITDGLLKRLRGIESEIRHLGEKLNALVKDGRHGAPEFHALAVDWFAFRTRARDIALELERRRLLFSPAINDGLLRADIRALILTQSNLVFATLSQCGSSAICEIAPVRVRFQACVVDEAAQCVEPSVLVPLGLGVERCIMVGDPNQLPATVLSDSAMRAKYEQSLFERLQLAGHAVHLLDTQYRCRPEMSSFSSQQFYQGKLKDGANVLDPGYHLRPEVAVGPLVFYDVGFGFQRRSSSSGGHSLFNEEEVEVCHELYLAIRASNARAQVAIISPYKDQLVALQRRFAGAAASLKQDNRDAHLEFNTVDGFQGREVDVVIFSCVRSKEEEELGGTGIGFLADARRLNVAVTRARYNLLVVGNYAVLKRSALWRKFLDHIKRAGKTVQMRDVRDIF